MKKPPIHAIILPQFKENIMASLIRGTSDSNRTQMDPINPVQTEVAEAASFTANSAIASLSQMPSSVSSKPAARSLGGHLSSIKEEDDADTNERIKKVLKILFSLKGATFLPLVDFNGNPIPDLSPATEPSEEERRAEIEIIEKELLPLLQEASTTSSKNLHNPKGPVHPDSHSRF